MGAGGRGDAEWLTWNGSCRRRTAASTGRAELRQGRKVSHWMWFVFPQIAGLGRARRRRFAIGLAEARAYLAHPVLGPRLVECAGILAGLHGRSAHQILGDVDALKLRSSMTLFARAAEGPRCSGEVLDRYFDGDLDSTTLQQIS